MILKALAKNPNERYQNACDMSDALSAGLAESGISRGDTTVKALATQARDQVASQTIKVTPETFAPARAAAVTAPAPAQPRRGLSPLVIGGAVVAVVAIVGAAIVAGPRLGLWGAAPQSTPAHAATAETASTQAPAGQVIAQPTLPPTAVPPP